jgi:hypothetical protein
MLGIENCHIIHDLQRWDLNAAAVQSFGPVWDTLGFIGNKIINPFKRNFSIHVAIGITGNGLQKEV